MKKTNWKEIFFVVFIFGMTFLMSKKIESLETTIENNTTKVDTTNLGAFGNYIKGYLDGLESTENEIKIDSIKVIPLENE